VTDIADEPQAAANVQLDDASNLSPTAISTERPEQIPDTGWTSLKTGLERRIINLRNEQGIYKENLYLLRIDPEFFRFDVVYKPGNAKSLTDWQIDTGALIVVNAGYFTEANQATGLIVVNGMASGVSYQGYGGMFAILQDSTQLRWLQQSGQIGYSEEDGLPARRTVIGQDEQGKFVFILATTGTMTLHEMSQFLANSDLELVLALNLDGGSSTGLLLSDPVEGIPPFTLLPAVITVHSKSE
jgi:hypothetical protein